MQRATIDLWVGIFVVAGIAALLFLALKVGNMGSFDSTSSYTVKAEFDNIGGLKAKAPIKSAGVVVGRVAGIDFDAKTYEATVSMKIDSRYHFPTDTIAAIMTSGLLGEQYIALEAGGEAKMLAAGDTLKMTQSAVVLENMIGQFLANKSDGDSKSSSPAKPGKGL